MLFSKIYFLLLIIVIERLLSLSYLIRDEKYNETTADYWSGPWDRESALEESAGVQTEG